MSAISSRMVLVSGLLGAILACSTRVPIKVVPRAAPTKRVQFLGQDPLPLGDFEPTRFQSFDVAAPEKLPQEVRRPDQIACSFNLDHWSGPIRLTPNGAPFAELAGAYDVAIAIPQGDANQGARATLELPGLHLAAMLAARDLEVYLKRPKLVAGYLMPRVGIALKWSEARSNSLVLSLPSEMRLHTATSIPNVVLHCDEVTLDSASIEKYDEFATVTSKKVALETTWIGTERVPLSLRANAAPIAFLDTRAANSEEEPDTVTVIGQEGKQRRIAVSFR